MIFMAQKFQNYIAGSWCDSSDGKTFENRNHANWDDIIGVFPLSTASDVDRGVNASAEAYKSWRLVPAPSRGDICRKAGEIMARRKEEIASIMTREMGKPLTETRGDVQE